MTRDVQKPVVRGRGTSYGSRLQRSDTSSDMRRPTRRLLFLLAGLALLLVALCIVSLGIGRHKIPIPTIVRILIDTIPSVGGIPAWSRTDWIVVTVIRAPRIIVAVVAGMGLSLSGAVLQGMFRNPLVGPEIVGVSHGAAFGGVLSILLGAGTIGIVTGAMGGGISALLLCFALARKTGKSILALVLTGFIVSAFFGASVGVVQYVADPEVQLPNIVYWLLGSFANADWTKAATIAAPFALSAILLLRLSWRINLLSLDEFDATVLGVNVVRLRWLLIVLVTFVVASQVAVSGGIGWIGLIIPHFARMLSGPDHQKLLPTSALIGGIYVLAIDDIARSISSQEIPLGILTAFIGTPVFAWLLKRHHTGGWER